MEIIMLLLVALVVLVAMVASRFIDNSNPFQVQKRSSLFSPVERSFQNLLEKAVEGEYKILNRIKLADLIEVKGNANEKARRSTLVKLNAKYLDFVLCSTDDLRVIAVLDLVNNSNKDGHKAAPDWFVSGALEAAGVPYLRIKIKAGYTSTDLQQALAQRLGKPAVKAEPMYKGLVKKGPTRPVRSYKPAQPAGTALTPVLSHSQIKAQQTGLIQAS
ncbi:MULTISPECIES: DUF2726 domain-containing protein [unclassified Arsukibacterium]|uniref:DUF2726 domain-containing protein n=1 Tax=unclassified Arsukibacterium TaxID=2635278 RepID=UPI000C48D592|nr:MULTISPECIES: DUF2726 domain-containing protein [unclassified Arsukibacterium]MAA95740.1 hypothetical protein [Rheinheimera sp.]MBM34558.1 hypothetical protein [Rheinheimera sp.]HAW91575.1 hypothetical protein [Candidatus Azambacteria bacterium]|tara:strand:+ start:1048 stop:1698 length:651 start_codon:yes stop_codon:yes gene_type:complete